MTKNESWVVIKNVNSHALMEFEVLCTRQNTLMGATTSAMMDAENILGNLMKDLGSVGTPAHILSKLNDLINNIDDARHEILDTMQEDYEEVKTKFFRYNGWLPEQQKVKE